MSSNNIKVLVVEDTLTLRVITKKMLEAAGYEVHEASNGEEGLRMLSMFTDIKLVFLDVMMPKMDGEEFLKRTIELKKELGFKICMLTAKEQDQDVKEFLVKGADDYLIKPIDRDLILEKAKILTQGIGNYMFASIVTKFEAKILRVNSFIDVFITNMSESEIKFTSTVDLPIGAKIQLQCDQLGLIIGSMKPVVLRIYQCERSGRDFNCRASFVGLREETCKKIRSVTTRGEALDE